MKDIAFSIADTPIPMPGGLPSILTDDPNQALKAIIQTAIELLFVIAILSAISLIIYAGILWITSGGDKEKLQKARSRLTYAIVGLSIVLASFLIVSVIVTILGGTPSLYFKVTP